MVRFYFPYNPLEEFRGSRGLESGGSGGGDSGSPGHRTEFPEVQDRVPQKFPRVPRGTELPQS